jgi:integrase
MSSECGNRASSEQKGRGQRARAKPPWANARRCGSPGWRHTAPPTTKRGKSSTALWPAAGAIPLMRSGHRELDAWLRSLSELSPVTQHNYWRITRRFFGWCQDFLEVVPRNPMKRLQERRLEHQDPEILTPDQMRACLAATVGERRLLAYIALGGFAGLRTDEVLRQDWADIDWAAGEIYVRQPKRVAGWRPRHVGNPAGAPAAP